MNLNYYYWHFTSALSDRLCDEIVKYGYQQKLYKGTTGDNHLKKNLKKDGTLKKSAKKSILKSRNSNIVFLNDRWIYKEIQPYVHQANANAGWNFEWDWSESCQFTEYSKNQHYDWHCDSWIKPYDDPKEQESFGKIRKLSVTVSLTNPNDYEGGNLEFDFRNYKYDKDKRKTQQVCKEIRPRGSIIVFPSFVYHRVTPVTKGVRNSLVIWNLGYPFK